jgi:hypothetical protein
MEDVPKEYGSVCQRLWTRPLKVYDGIVGIQRKWQSLQSIEGMSLICPGFNGIGSILVILLAFACEMAKMLSGALAGVPLVMQITQSAMIPHADAEV